MSSFNFLSAKNLPGTETNWLKRFWILFWYNELTRFLMVLLPGHFLLTLPLLRNLGLEGEDLRTFALGSYCGIMLWAIVDNDFETNLRKIGRRN